MELTYDELIAGKATCIRNRSYFKTKDYVDPFIERMSRYTSDFIFQAKEPDQVSLTNQGEVANRDTIWNRVWIQAVLPNEFDNHKRVIGMVYGLDLRKPVVKIYSGALNMACLNLCVFDPSFLSVKELEPEMPMNYSDVETFVNREDNMQEFITRLKNTEVPYNEEIISKNLGDWVRNAIYKSYDTGFNKVKLASSVPVGAYKLLYEDQESPYYVKPGESTSMFNVYNSFTECITHDGTKCAKDILNKAEKTLLLKNILTL